MKCCVSCVLCVGIAPCMEDCVCNKEIGHVQKGRSCVCGRTGEGGRTGHKYFLAAFGSDHN